jgi:hypothetical protein
MYGGYEKFNHNKVTDTNKGGWHRERDTSGICFTVKQLNTLYTNSLKLTGSRGHVTMDAQKRPKLGRSRSCPSLQTLIICSSGNALNFHSRYSVWKWFIEIFISLSRLMLGNCSTLRQVMIATFQIFSNSPFMLIFPSNAMLLTSAVNRLFAPLFYFIGKYFTYASFWELALLSVRTPAYTSDIGQHPTCQ